MQQIDKFTMAFIECALFSEFLDSVSIADIPANVLAKIIKDCADFQKQAGELISECNLVYQTPYSVEEIAGHDFYLTRNGHGAGFWDGHWNDDVGKMLTSWSKKFGEYHIEYALP
jgi:hypothetical protein